MPLKGGLLLTADHIPQHNRIVPTPNGQSGPIRENATDLIPGSVPPFESGLLLTAGHIPQHNRLVITDTGQDRPIRENTTE